MSTTDNLVQFETGRAYFCRSIGDWNCIFTYEVVRRTAKSVWVREAGRHGTEKIERRKIKVYNGREYFEPHGSYSMSASIYADSPVATEEPKRAPLTLVKPEPEVNPHVDLIERLCE